MLPKAVLIIERMTNKVVKRIDTSKMSEAKFKAIDNALVNKTNWEKYYFRRVGPKEVSPRDFAEGDTYKGK